MATGVVSWSQTAATNATADSTVNMAEGMAPSAVNDSVRALMASVAKWRDDVVGNILASGTGTVYVVATNQVFPSLAAMTGQSIRVRFNSVNVFAAAINVDGLGAKTMYVANDPASGLPTPIPAGFLQVNTIRLLTYYDSVPGWFINDANATTIIPTGTVQAYASTSAPSGWLLCDGAAVSRTTYAGLFSVISTGYGSGNGSTTFNVPNLMGRVVAGKETTATLLTAAVGGVDGATLGAVGGIQGITLTTAQLPSHTHTGTTGTESATHTHTTTGSAAFGGSNTANFNLSGGGTSVPTPTVNLQSLSTGTESAAHVHTFTSDASGSDTSHGNVQPTIVLNYIIKT